MNLKDEGDLTRRNTQIRRDVLSRLTRKAAAEHFRAPLHIPTHPGGRTRGAQLPDLDFRLMQTLGETGERVIGRGDWLGRPGRRLHLLNRYLLNRYRLY